MQRHNIRALPGAQEILRAWRASLLFGGLERRLRGEFSSLLTLGGLRRASKLRELGLTDAGRAEVKASPSALFIPPVACLGGQVVGFRAVFGMTSLFRIGWRGTFPHRHVFKDTLMAFFQTRAIVAVTRVVLRYPCLAWWLVQRVGPWLVRRFRRSHPAAEEQALAALTQELRQATVGNDTDWYDVQVLGELCIRQRAYVEAAQHFRRVVAAADDRELRRSAAAWLARALEYAGDRQGACLAYREYLHNFPEVSQFERRRLERRVAELCASLKCPDDVHPLLPSLSASERPSRISVRRHPS